MLKFTCKTYSAYNPPRSCAGRLEASQSLSGVGVIVCKPPKFAEVGDYLVSVSMDGANFLPQQLEISVYQDVTVLSQAPALVDLREKGETLPISLVSVVVWSACLIVSHKARPRLSKACPRCRTIPDLRLSVLCGCPSVRWTALQVRCTRHTACSILFKYLTMDLCRRR